MRSHLVEWFWPRYLMRLQLYVSWGYNQIKICLGLDGPLPGGLCTELALVPALRVYAILMHFSIELLDCPHQSRFWPPKTHLLRVAGSPQSTYPGDRSENTFYDLASKVTHENFWALRWSRRPLMIHYGRRQNKEVPWKPSWRLTVTQVFYRAHGGT